MLEKVPLSMASPWCPRSPRRGIDPGYKGPVLWGRPFIHLGGTLISGERVGALLRQSGGEELHLGGLDQKAGLAAGTMLKITATGNLTNDVELKLNETTGKPYAILRIASDRGRWPAPTGRCTHRPRRRCW